jgi:Ran GTPase-activating protein (RanGAP) involved in mRNA processing and transport
MQKNKSNKLKFQRELSVLNDMRNTINHEGFATLVHYETTTDHYVFLTELMGKNLREIKD